MSEDFAYISNEDYWHIETHKLREENAKLKIKIRELEEKIYTKNQTISRLQRDSWDDVTNDRDR